VHGIQLGRVSAGRQFHLPCRVTEVALEHLDPSGRSGITRVIAVKRDKDGVSADGEHLNRLQTGHGEAAGAARRDLVELAAADGGGEGERVESAFDDNCLTFRG
jgi:hypothetical protein